MATRVARLRFAANRANRKHPEAGQAVAPGGGMMVVVCGVGRVGWPPCWVRFSAAQISLPISGGECQEGTER